MGQWFPKEECGGELVLPPHLMHVPSYACRVCGAHGRPGVINGEWCYLESHKPGCPHKGEAAYVPLEVKYGQQQA